MDSLIVKTAFTSFRVSVGLNILFSSAKLNRVSFCHTHTALSIGIINNKKAGVKLF